MTTKKSERLLYLINLFQSGKRYTVGELADRAGVSERTIYRDIVDLSTLVPVYYDDGYRLLGEATLLGVALTRDELLALRVGVDVPPLTEASHLAVATRSALAKIESILAKRFDEPVADLEEVIGIHVTAAPMSEEMVERLRLIERSVVNRKSMYIKYAGAHGRAVTEREIDPYGLCFRRHAWYVVAFCRLREDMRLFRAERIISARPTGNSFTRPADFSIESFFEGAWELSASGELCRVVIEFDPQVAPLVEASYGSRGKVRHLAGGRLRFAVDVRGLSEIFRWVLGYGAFAKVLEPPELVAMVREEAARLLARYPER